MDEARKKLRVCLIFVVAAAVIIGFIYYIGDMKEKSNMSEGTLVMTDVKRQGAGRWQETAKQYI